MGSRHSTVSTEIDTETGVFPHHTPLSIRRRLSGGDGSDPDVVASLNSLWRRETVVDTIRKQSGAISKGEANQMAKAFHLLSPEPKKRKHQRTRTTANFDFNRMGSLGVSRLGMIDESGSSSRSGRLGGSAHRRTSSAPEHVAAFNLRAVDPLDLMPSITEMSRQSSHTQLSSHGSAGADEEGGGRQTE